MANGSRVDLFVQNVFHPIVDCMKRQCDELEVLNIGIKEAIDNVRSQSNCSAGSVVDSEQGITNSMRKYSSDSCIVPATRDTRSEIHYNCRACGKVALLDTIQCDTCLEWYHYECVDLVKADVNTIPEAAPYNCPLCCDNAVYRQVDTAHTSSASVPLCVNTDTSSVISSVSEPQAIRDDNHTVTTTNVVMTHSAVSTDPVAVCASCFALLPAVSSNSAATTVLVIAATSVVTHSVVSSPAVATLIAASSVQSTLPNVSPITNSTVMVSSSDTVTPILSTSEGPRKKTSKASRQADSVQSENARLRTFIVGLQQKILDLKRSASLQHTLRGTSGGLDSTRPNTHGGPVPHNTYHNGEYDGSSRYDPPGGPDPRYSATSAYYSMDSHVSHLSHITNSLMNQRLNMVDQKMDLLLEYQKLLCNSQTLL